jgi:hypothetical protein
VCDRRAVSVIGAGLARADIPPRDPPPSKGCGVETGWVTLVAVVIVGFFLLRGRRARGR